MDEQMANLNVTAHTTTSVSLSLARSLGFVRVDRNAVDGGSGGFQSHFRFDKAFKCPRTNKQKSSSRSTHPHTRVHVSLSRTGTLEPCHYFPFP